jgi:hypothetical protein
MWTVMVRGEMHTGFWWENLTEKNHLESRWDNIKMNLKGAR